MIPANAYRFCLQISIVLSAIILTAALIFHTGIIPDDVLDIIKQSLSVVWTLVAFIIRDVRNRDSA